MSDKRLIDPQSAVDYMVKAAPEYNEVRNALNPIPSSNFRVGFGVHFEDDGLARHFAGDRTDLGSGHFAWAAPWGPDIDENG